MRVGLALLLRIRKLPERVALPADLRRQPRIEAHRLNDCGVRAAGEVQDVPSQRAAVGAHVRLTRPVARLARDAELRGAGVGHLREDRLRPERRVELRLTVGRVAGDADAIPATCF